MKKIFALIVILIFSSAYAQNKVSREFIQSVKEEIRTVNNERKERLNDYFENHPQAKRNIIEGKKISIAYDVIEGQLVYISNFNEEAAEATRTNFLKQGSSLNLDLEGDGMNIGLWEVGGSPLTSHVEFDDNGTSRIIISDGASNEIIYHASHVAGTLAAKGANPNAKGMASEATVLSYDAIDDNTEALNQATNNALLISNHSYGIPVSSESNTAPASLMGTYNGYARVWDLIAESAPYYLSVFSAGNDGSSSYNGGSLNGYDKLTGEKNSKNNLVVANASNIFTNSSSGDYITSTINSSSSQGPSDDGRIKPDITGLGTGIFSTSNVGDTAYGTSTGTSMSAPNVSGSLLLLQELYFNLNNEYMRSSTIKGLALITADDAGNNGPDAIFGWGILNAKKAAETIIAADANQDALISENVLNNDQQITFDVVSNGIDPLNVGVFWSDPAGFAQTGSTNSTIPALVNDVDLKLIDENGIEYFPWRLNLSNFAGSAQKGINSVDNNEVVEVEFPTSSTYTVVIDHKASLTNNLQNISIIATGITSHNLSSESPNNLEFAVWPNPVNDILYIKSQQFSSETSFTLYDVSGRLVKSGKMKISEAINLSELVKGVYILKVFNSEGTLTKKIIKQ